MLIMLDYESMDGEIKSEKWGRLLLNKASIAAVEAEQVEMIERH